MWETTLAKFHGSDRKNRLGMFPNSLAEPTVDTVKQNAFFWYDEVPLLKVLSGEKV